MAPAETPLMQQFFEFKARYPDAILFMRCGDFYEMFHEDARVAARELQVALTARNKQSEEPVPMAGVPFHAYEDYAARLIEKGYKIAICEQVEDPKQAKGIVRRDVTHVITPGTVTLQGALKPSSNNYLGCLIREGREYWLATLDATTGEARVGQFRDNLSEREELFHELLRIRTSELLVPARLMEDDSFQNGLFQRLIENGLLIQRLEKTIPRKTPRFRSGEWLSSPVLHASGLSEKSPARYTLEGLFQYLEDCNLRSQIARLEVYSSTQCLKIDAQSLRNLELVEGMHADSISLFDVIDHTGSAAGTRLLKRHLTHPLLDPQEIESRQDTVERLIQTPQALQSITRNMQEIYDLYRLCTRLLNQQASGRDLKAIQKTLDTVPGLQAALEDAGLNELLDDLQNPASLAQRIDQAIEEDPPLRITEGRLIRKGFDTELDELLELEENGDRVLKELEAREKEKHGLKSLKLKYNRVFGYYFELPRLQAESAPEHFVRKQTLSNAERFTTEELKQLETSLMSATQKSQSLQYALFQTLRLELLESLPLIQAWAERLAWLDVMASHAHMGLKNDWIRPVVQSEGEVRILEGRHPVVEAAQKHFTPNDLFLSHAQDQVLLITGPNMGGKSTYLRQAALIVILAQCGSQVPAKSCSLPIFERVFTRIGASDNLSAGKSTFMVEMSETAYLLQHADEKSLLLLDEIGRGTATFDGLSLAWAILEHIATTKKSLCLFATHYHEMTQMSQIYPQVRNCCVEVLEQGRDIQFLHRIRRGTADRSYGIHVARLAGLPTAVLKQAELILQELESSRSAVIQLDSQAHRLILKGRQQTLGSPKKAAQPPVVEHLQKLNPDKMSPVEALNALYALKDLLASDTLNQKEDPT